MPVHMHTGITVAATTFLVGKSRLCWEVVLLHKTSRKVTARALSQSYKRSRTTAQLVTYAVEVLHLDSTTH